MCYVFLEHEMSYISKNPCILMVNFVPQLKVFQLFVPLYLIFHFFHRKRLAGFKVKSECMPFSYTLYMK